MYLSNKFYFKILSLKKLKLKKIIFTKIKPLNIIEDNLIKLPFQGKQMSNKCDSALLFIRENIN